MNKYGAQITLTQSEIEALRTLIYSDIKYRADKQVHAVSHGDSYHDPVIDALVVITTKINGAKIINDLP